MAVVGPTASGKSAAALALAEHLGGEILSVDSMQVYRGMDIGTAKATPAERARAPHHLIDLVDPDVEFSVAEFQKAGRGVLDELAAGGIPAVITGGSGLHFRALVDPLEFPPTDDAVRRDIDSMDDVARIERLQEVDPLAEGVVDLANPRRVARALEVYELTGATPTDRAQADAATAVRSYEPAVPFLGLALDAGDELPRRAEERCREMLERGLVDEVEGLRPRLGITASQAVGYKEVLPFLDGAADIESTRRAIVDATTSLAHRQRVFFRRDPRLRWLAWRDDPQAVADQVIGVAEEALA